MNLETSMSFLASLFDGSMGWAILCLALAVRFALLPLTLHMARKALANQQKIKALQPQVEAIRARLKDKPQEAFAAVAALYKENGVRLVDRSTLIGALVQLPVFGLLYRTISQASAGKGAFLWMKSLASPDAALTALILLLTGFAAWYYPSASADPSMLMVAMQVAIMAFMVWKLSAGLGLYWAASSGVNAVQTLMLRRERHRAAGLAAARQSARR
ncbi:YidC/Oxa1 family membrane protein insertase [Massilia aerilata]|uniref:YidC/Oxa1 family membrane protein insertase n=1 Tax=Massilia aerilata TaxID=453817 RepID=A0ABW0RV57_9BURK